jgi:hypothetical protein
MGVSKPFHSTGFGVTCEAHTPLTRQALQKHNTTKTSLDGDRGSTQVRHRSFRRDIKPGDTAHIFIMAAEDDAVLEPYSYPRRRPQIQTSTESSADHKFNFDIGVFHSQHVSEIQGTHQYPVFIHEEDIHDHIGQWGSTVEHASMKQNPATCDHALAGVGSQFSG